MKHVKVCFLKPVVIEDVKHVKVCFKASCLVYFKPVMLEDVKHVLELGDRREREPI